MQRLEVSGAVRPTWVVTIYGSLGVKRLRKSIQYIYTFTTTTNTLVNSFIYMAAGFDPKFRS